MRDIVTDPITDYIYVTHFAVLADHLSRLIELVCAARTSPVPSSTTSPHIGASTSNFHIHFYHGLSQHFVQNLVLRVQILPLHGVS